MGFNQILILDKIWLNIMIFIIKKIQLFNKIEQCILIRLDSLFFCFWLNLNSLQIELFANRYYDICFQLI